MLPLFRKIRRPFADENQLFKYSRYVIGEIILVVIGILIALQVNNWNEELIERNRINTCARSLIKDLESAHQIITTSICNTG